MSTKNKSAQDLTTTVRANLSRQFAALEANAFAMAQLFQQSQSWEGFDRAFRRWHDARWKWVDEQTPADVVAKLKALPVDWSKLPSKTEESKQLITPKDTFFRPKVPPDTKENKEWSLETFRQQYLLRRAIFLTAMSWPDAARPETYRIFLDVMRNEDRLGDGSVFEALAKQKQRKPTKSHGGRHLKYRLLKDWIGGCLWAFTTEGIAAFLHMRYSGEGVGKYHLKKILDCRRVLKLFLLTRAKFSGVSDVPSHHLPLTL